MTLKGKNIPAIDLSTAVRVEHLKCVSLADNSKKLYSMYLLPSGEIYTEACREGETPKPCLYQRGDKFFGSAGFGDLLREKTSAKKGYKPVEVAETKAVAIDWSALGERGSEIQSQITGIARRFEGVSGCTEIRFSPELGVFVTQQGAITLRVVQTAQRLLSNIQSASGYQRDNLIEDYMNCIPVKASRTGFNVQHFIRTIDRHQEMLSVLTQCLGDLQLLGNSIRQAVQSQNRALFDQDAFSVFVVWGDPEKTNDRAAEGGEESSYLNFAAMTVGVSW